MTRSKNSPEAEALAAYSIGPKLRTLRNDKGFTLARLGSETNLSTALLSKLESESMIPTLQTLARICRVYGVDLSFFFAAPSKHSLAITRRAHITQERRGQIAHKEVPLHRSNPTSRQVSKIVDLPAGASWNVGDPGTRTELTAYVLEGTLHLATAGSVEVLEIGDCLVVDTDTMLLWTTTARTHSRVLVVFARTSPE